MENKHTTFSTVETEMAAASRHWWIPLILSVLSIGLGIWLFFTPVEGFAALTLLFAVNFAIIAVGSTVITIRNRHLMPLWGLHLALNLLMLVLAGIMLFNLNLSAGILIYYVAFYTLFVGINSIILAVSTKTEGWGWDLFIGIITVIAAIILMLHPVVAILTVTTLSGIALAVAGISFAVLAYRLYKLQHLPED